jgi:hypothetical protein
VLGLALIPVFWISLAAVAGRLLGNQPPFQGKELTQLTATNSFLFAILVLAGSIWLISQVFSDWNGKNILRLGVLGLTAILAFLTPELHILPTISIRQCQGIPGVRARDR